MAGLVPAIHVLQNLRMAGGYVYFLTNRPNGILYDGVTNDLVRRDAIQREHNIKHWSRAWKIRTIIAANPNWDDLYPTITQ